MSNSKDIELVRFQMSCWQTARESGITLATPGVMALSLLASGPNTTTKVLQAMGMNLALIEKDLRKSLGGTSKTGSPKKKVKATEGSAIPLSQGGREVMKIAAEVCELMGDPAIGTHHIMMALLESDASMSFALGKRGISYHGFRAVAKDILSVENRMPPVTSTGSGKKELVADQTDASSAQGQQAKKQQVLTEKEILARYCKNLTVLAKEGKLDPVIGRESEIGRLTTTLGRRKKNNAILVGEPGVGKTAIVEGLAQRIVEGKVPVHMKSSQLFQLNMTAVVSKTTYRGQFEERMRAIMELFAANKEYVLFVDEMHTLIGAGGSVGGLDAANIMKPALASGDVRCIGATTEDEYRKYFKRDGALDRRFQRIFVDEPTKEEAVTILTGMKSVMELHHGCVIPDDVVKSAVELSSRHIPDRFLPDKAIDCLDEACANAMSRTGADRKAKTKMEITKDDIVKAIASQSDMSEEIVGVSDVNRAKILKGFLKKRVVGHEKPIDAISTALLGAYAGIRNQKRPIGCFVFGGPSGSGTTFVAEKIAEGLFESDASLVRINMSEFSEKFGNTRLIGSPPGYVGYGDKNQLTDRVARKPYCLVLLDGIENANEDVVRLFMQAMSKGVMTDASGRDVSFKNTVIIMTMTCKASSKSAGMGFNDGESAGSSSQREFLSEECRKKFGEDFVNRVDEFVVFGELGKDDIRKVAAVRLEELAARLLEIGVRVGYSDQVVDMVVSGASCGKNNGVKAIDRYVKRDVESLISLALSDGDTQATKLYIDMEDGKLSCNVCVEATEASA